ncbi:MAG: methylated-DNA--[protein]-cysteine S-methyltransferase [Xanthobacteraceae bacterium]
MSDICFALFDTAIGRCGIVWSERGVARVGFPERSERATRQRLLRRFPDARGIALPPQIQRAIDDIAALLAGERRDLTHVRIDTADLPEFNRRVYAVARGIPPGTTLSYGEIAERLGDKALARDVGQALGQNPLPIIVPCHRVLAAGGKMGGFSAPGGIETKLRLLEIEQAQPGGPTLFEHLPLTALPPARSRAR